MPYVVKGMDLSFSGMMSAAKEAAAVHPKEDVCFSLQENAFAIVNPRTRIGRRNQTPQGGATTST